MSDSSAKKAFIMLFGISIVLLFVTFMWAIEFSSFAVGITKFSVSLLIVYAIDRFALPEVDTISIIGENPIAYSIFMLGIFILAGLCIATS